MLPRPHVAATCIADSEMPHLPVDTITMEATTAVRDADALCARIVEAIADHADTEPLEMTPLGYVFDPDALDVLINTGTDVRVTFEYCAHTVVVRADGTISVDGDEYDDAPTGGGQ